jgi:hypothetical protein
MDGVPNQKLAQTSSSGSHMHLESLSQQAFFDLTKQKNTEIASSGVFTVRRKFVREL